MDIGPLLTSLADMLRRTLDQRVRIDKLFQWYKDELAPAVAPTRSPPPPTASALRSAEDRLRNAKAKAAAAEQAVEQARDKLNEAIAEAEASQLKVQEGEAEVAAIATHIAATRTNGGGVERVATAMAEIAVSTQAVASGTKEGAIDGLVASFTTLSDAIHAMLRLLGQEAPGNPHEVFDKAKAKWSISERAAKRVKSVRQRDAKRVEKVDSDTSQSSRATRTGRARSRSPSRHPARGRSMPPSPQGGGDAPMGEAVRQAPPTPIPGAQGGLHQQDHQEAAAAAPASPTVPRSLAEAGAVQADGHPAEVQRRRSAKSS